MTNLQKTPDLNARDASYFAQLLAIYDEQSVLSPLEVLMERLEGEAMYHSDLAEQIEIDFEAPEREVSRFGEMIDIDIDTGDADFLEMTAYYEDEVVEALAAQAEEALYAL